MFAPFDHFSVSRLLKCSIPNESAAVVVRIGLACVGKNLPTAPTFFVAVVIIVFLIMLGVRRSYSSLGQVSGGEGERNGCNTKRSQREIRNILLILKM